MKIFVLSVLALGLVSGGSPVTAQQPDATTTSGTPTRIQVNAPFAEQLILKIKAEHPEIQKLGLHAVPPGQTHSAIIANNYPEKVGKLSSASDLATVADGQPKAKRVEQGHFFDTFVPLHDEGGEVIGFLIMEVPFSTAATEAGAIAVGVEIRNEVQRQVPTAETLFGPEQK